MTDNEVKTPNKRKSLAPQTPGKKPKLENGAAFTPSKKGFNKNTPKPKSPKQNQPEKKNASPQKVKPFAGTAKLDNKKKPKVQLAAKQGQVQSDKKKSRNQFKNIIVLIKSDDPSNKAEALKKLENKIKAIESRPDQTKTSKRKLNWLKTQKNILEGKPPKEHTKTNTKTESQKRRERKKKSEKNADVKQGKKQKQPKKEEEEEDDESDDEETNEGKSDEDSLDDSAEVEGEESGDDEEDGEEEEDDDDDSDQEQDDESDEEESEDEAPKLVAPKEKKPKKVEPKKTEIPSNIKQKKEKLSNDSAQSKEPQLKEVSIDQLKKKELIAKGQKRFVLFVGNIAYDTTKQDLIGHFSKAGEILHIRIPLEKKSNKPRGFAYLELNNEETYQKCLSMHHSFLNSRRINVLYTQGGKKKGDDKKKEIKAKNMKLHAMRKQGKLAGSVKESNKRSFRRNKKKNFDKKESDGNE